MERAFTLEASFGDSTQRQLPLKRSRSEPSAAERDTIQTLLLATEQREDLRCCLADIQRTLEQTGAQFVDETVRYSHSVKTLHHLDVALILDAEGKVCNWYLFLLPPGSRFGRMNRLEVRDGEIHLTRRLCGDLSVDGQTDLLRRGRHVREKEGCDELLIRVAVENLSLLANQ
jgi:hypothetical protein